MDFYNTRRNGLQWLILQCSTFWRYHEISPKDLFVAYRLVAKIVMRSLKLNNNCKEELDELFNLSRSLLKVQCSIHWFFLHDLTLFLV